MEGKVKEHVWWLVTPVGSRIEVIIEINNVRVIEYGPDNLSTFKKACSRIESSLDDLGKDYLAQMKEAFTKEVLL